jgi:hypothetical protein
MIVPAFGITGGIRSGVWYFGTDNGSSVPPEIGAANAPGTIQGMRIKHARTTIGRKYLVRDIS